MCVFDLSNLVQQTAIPALTLILLLKKLILAQCSQHLDLVCFSLLSLVRMQLYVTKSKFK